MPAIEALGARDAVAITKSDDTIVNIDALYVGGTGDVAVLMQGGTTVTFASVPAGTILPVRAKKVMATNTDATDMIGLRY